MEQDNFHRIDNDSVENQVTTSSKQELCTQVNEQFDKIAKRAAKTAAPAASAAQPAAK